MNDEIMFAREDELEALNAAPDDGVDSQKYLIFMSDDLKMGVVAENVVEILNNQTITYLPMVPEFIRGIINMRGQMVPILDIRLRLGKPSLESNTLVIVLNLEGTQLGILVDAVDQMLDIPKDHILHMPAHSTQLLVSGMCSLPDGSGTMMVLDFEQLMPHD